MTISRARPDRLLLCEGPDDAAFFREFISSRGLPDFRIEHNGTRSDPRGGHSKFVNGLRAHFELHGNKRFKEVVLVADADENPGTRFAEVRDQVEKYFKFSPSAPRARAKGPPGVTVLLMPWDDEPGNLESACVDAAMSADSAMASHVHNFASVANVDKWRSETRQKEMKLRANLAARCERNPFVSLRDVFVEPAYRSLIPLSDKSFDRLADFFRGF